MDLELQVLSNSCLAGLRERLSLAPHIRGSHSWWSSLPMFWVRKIHVCISPRLLSSLAPFEWTWHSLVSSSHTAANHTFSAFLQLGVFLHTCLVAHGISQNPWIVAEIFKTLIFWLSMVQASLYHLKGVGFFFPFGCAYMEVVWGGEISSPLRACTALPDNSGSVPAGVSQLAVTLLPENPVHLASAGACTYIHIATQVSCPLSLPPPYLPFLLFPLSLKI